jgi:hypothetical protein
MPPTTSTGPSGPTGATGSSGATGPVEAGSDRPVGEGKQATPPTTTSNSPNPTGDAPVIKNPPPQGYPKQDPNAGRRG